MKRFYLFLLLIILSSTAWGIGDIPPYGKNLYKVCIFKTDNTQTIGYIEVYPNPSDQEYYKGPERVPIKKNTDVLPLLRTTYQKIDSLEVDTELYKYGGMNFMIDYYRTYLHFNKINKIVTLEDTEPMGSGTIFVNYGSLLSGDEYHILEGKTNLMMYGSCGACILNANPDYDKTDIYMVACFLGYDPDIDQRSFHPFLSSEQMEDFEAKMSEFWDGNNKNNDMFIKTLTQCKKTWLEIGKRLVNNQIIVPKQKAETIANLDTLAAECDNTILLIQAIQNQKSTQQTAQQITDIYSAMKHCIFPNLALPSDFDEELLPRILLKKGVVVKYMHYYD